MDKMREALALEIANVRFNGNQSDSLKDRAKDWLWNNIGRIEAVLRECKPTEVIKNCMEQELKERGNKQNV